jgi:hypothetical protein
MTAAFIGIIGIIGLSLVMWGLTTIYKKTTKNKASESKVNKNDIDKKANSKEESAFEKYCNDKKDDNYKIRANWILLHDKNERDDRGQKDSM